MLCCMHTTLKNMFDLLCQSRAVSCLHREPCKSRWHQIWHAHPWWQQFCARWCSLAFQPVCFDVILLLWWVWRHARAHIALMCSNGWVLPYAKVSSVPLCMLLLSGALHHLVLHVVLIMWRTCTCTASKNMDRKCLITKGDAPVDMLFKKPKKVLSTADHSQSMLYCMTQVATTVIDAVQHC